MSEELAIPRFQLPDPEPMSEQEKGDSSFRNWKQRKFAEGYKYRCPKCRTLSKIINKPCEDCGAMPKKW